MAVLRHNDVPQDGHDSGDGRDDDGRDCHPQPEPVLADSINWLLIALLYIARLLIQLVQLPIAIARHVQASPLQLQPPPGAAGPPAIPPGPGHPFYRARPHHLGQRWYVVYVGSTVGVFNEW